MDGCAHFLEHACGEGARVARCIARLGAELRRLALPAAGSQDRRQVQAALARTLRLGQLQQVGTTDQLAQVTHAQPRHPLPGVFGDEAEIVHGHFRQPGEVVAAQPFVLGRHPGGAVVEVADAQVLAAERHHRRGAEAKALGPEDGTLDHVQPGLQAAVHLHADAMTQVAPAQGFVDLRQAQFPGRAGMVDGGHRRGAGAAVIAGHGDQVGVGLDHAGGDGADAGVRDQLHRHQRARVDLLQVIDQLRQVFDGVDVMVRWRRNQADARARMA